MNWLLAKYRPLFQLEAGGGEGGNVTSTPSPAPSSSSPDTSSSGSPSAGAPSSEPSAAPSAESIDFSLIFGEGEGESPRAPGQPPAAAPPKAEPQVQPPSGAEPPQAATPPAQPAAEPAAPAAPAPTGTPPAAPAANLDPYDPGVLARHLQRNEAAAIQHVADTVFKLSAEDIEALESDTVGTVPKLLARGFVRAQQSMLSQLERLVPRMLQSHNMVMKRHAENESKFYARWPDLKQDKHGQIVQQYAVTYRQLHPQATLEEMIEAVGPMVMIAAKVTPSGVQPQAATPSASPMAPTGSRPQPSPFVPAAPFAGGPTISQPVELSPIEAMFNNDG